MSKSLSSLFETEGDSKQKTSTTCPCGVIGSLLFKAQIDAHITHLLQKNNKTLAHHKALEMFYDEVGDLADGLIEKYMGLYEVSGLGVSSSNNIDNPIKYFTALYAGIDKARQSIKESFLQNEIDTIQALIVQTLYRLKHVSE